MSLTHNQYKLSHERFKEICFLEDQAQDDLGAVIHHLVGQREELREAISNLPEGSAPTFKLLECIRACRALLPKEGE